MLLTHVTHWITHCLITGRRHHWNNDINVGYSFQNNVQTLKSVAIHTTMAHTFPHNLYLRASWYSHFEFWKVFFWMCNLHQNNAKLHSAEKSFYDMPPSEKQPV